VTDPSVDAIQHDRSEGHRLNRKIVAKIDVNSEDGEFREPIDDALKDVIKFLPKLLLIFERHLFLENFVDFVDEVGLPAEELDRLDVVEALIDVKAALFLLAILLLSNV